MIVGECIYCQATSGELTDEHIMAAAMGGKEVLEKASCVTCQRIINKEVESPVFSNMMRDIRYRFNLPTRKRKQRQLGLGVYRNGSGRAQPISADSVFEFVTADEHHTSILLPVFDPPIYVSTGTLDSKGPVRYKTLWGWTYNPGFLGKDGSSTVGLKVMPLPFARFLAKTAHCSAIRYYGYRAFRPFLTEMILGRRVEELGCYVGCDPVIQPVSDKVHEGELLDSLDGQRMIMLRLRLFANLGAPTYLIIVGQRLAGLP